MLQAHRFCRPRNAGMASPPEESVATYAGETCAQANGDLPKNRILLWVNSMNRISTQKQSFFKYSNVMMEVITIDTPAHSNTQPHTPNHSAGSTWDTPAIDWHFSIQSKHATILRSSKYFKLNGICNRVNHVDYIFSNISFGSHRMKIHVFNCYDIKFLFT